MRRNSPEQRIFSASEAKALDKKAEDKFGVPTLLLMENAGSQVSQEALKILRNRPGKVAIFCGTGNNGGDGFCVARHLLVAGIKPDVYLAGKKGNLKDETKVNMDILLRLGQKIREVSLANIPFIRSGIKKHRLIIDALLGVGLKGEIRPLYLQLIESINVSGAYILSVDIPSGLDATSGSLHGACVKADLTVTFVGKKRGMISNIGKRNCGRVLVRSIGIVL